MNNNLSELEKMAMGLSLAEPFEDEKNEKKCRKSKKDKVGKEPKDKKPFFHKITKEEIKATLKPSKRLFTMAVIVVLSCVIVGETIFCGYLYKENKEASNYLFNPSSSKTQTDLTEAISALKDLSSVFDTNYVYDIDQEKLEEKLIDAYLDSVDDDYAEYYTLKEWQKETATMYGNSVGIGVMVTYKDGIITVSEVFPDSPAEKAGIKVLDIIAYADDKVLSDYEYEEALDYVRGEIGTKVVVGVIRDGKRINFEITRANYIVPTVYPEIKKIDGKKIGYLRITNFYSDTYKEFKAAIEKYIEEGVEGFVFDMRDNGGGLLSTVVSMLDYLLPEGPVVRLTYKDETNNQVISSDANYITDLPFVVITNGNTASAAELFTSCLKDYDRATIVGTKTYGKGCGQNTFNLKNGCIVKLTTFLYEPPYSDNYDGIGITPDIVVTLSEKYADYPITALTDSNDLQLKKALKLFK